MADNVVDVRFGAQTSGFRTGVADVKHETESLAAALNHQFSQMSAFIREPLDALAMMKSSLRETAEIAGAAFAVEKIREAINTMAELGERTTNMAAAVGTTPHEFSLLSGALRLATGEADAADRVLLRLGRSLQEALTVKSSQAAKAAASLGITHEELARASRDLSFALELLADKFVAFQDDMTKSADFTALLGRGWQNLVPLLRRGGDGFREAKDKAQELGIVLSDQESRALADTAEKIHELGATLEGIGVRGFMKFKGAIDIAITGLTSFIRSAADAIGEITNLSSHIDSVRTKNLQAQHAGEGGFLSGLFGAITPAPGTDVRSRNLREAADAATKAAAQVSGAAGFMEIPPVAPGQIGPAAKPAVAPWPEIQKGAKGASTEAKDYTAETQRAIQALETEQRVADIGFNAQIAHIQALVREKKLTADEGLAAEKKVVDAQLASDQGYLAKKAALYQAEADHEKKTSNAGLEGLQRVHDQEIILAATAAAKVSEYADKAAEVQANAAEKAAKAAEEAAKKWQDSWKGVGDQIATALADVLDRTTTFAKAMRSLVDSLLKDLFKSLFTGLLFGGPGGGGGAGGGLGGLLFGSQGLAGTLGVGSQGLLGSLLGKGLGLAEGGLLGGIGNALFGSAGLSGALGLPAGGLFGSSGLIGGAIPSGGLLGFLGGLFGAAAPLGVIEKGGIMPSAARGWVVPSFQGGGILSMLHKNEMVLPSHISDWIQSAAAGGGGNTVNMNISSWDSRDMMRAAPMLITALNSAMRNGSRLRVPS